MSEYWKSTPKYWCKFCKNYIRDTAFDKKQHEASGKHQGSIQRSLRDIHRAKEQEEREKKRAQAEIARLNGVVGGGSAELPWKWKQEAKPAATQRVATEADRKKQMVQLAEMGVAVPEEYRAEMALAGDWQTVSQRVVEPKAGVKEEDVKPEARAVGVRKRKVDDHGLEDEEDKREKRRWGTTQKKFPGSSQPDLDLDALLGGDLGAAVKREPEAKKDESAVVKAEPDLKREDSQEETTVKADLPEIAPGEAVPPVKTEKDAPAAAAPAPPVVFKKRKKKVTTLG